VKSTRPVSESLSRIEAAHGVLERQLGRRAGDFKLSMLTAAAHGAYEIEASAGIVRIAGTSAVAICRAAYAYLRYAARWAAWFGAQWTRAPFSLDIWQQAWLSKPYEPSSPASVNDPASYAHSIMVDCNLV
jgi:hypothetical protein